MAEAASKRLKQAATDLNVGTHTIVDFLATKGISVENKPTTKLSADQVALLNKEFASSAQDKAEATKRSQSLRHTELEQASQAKEAAKVVATPKPAEPVTSAPQPAATPAAEAKPASPAPQPAAAPTADNGRPVPGLKVLGKIELDAKGRPVPPKPAQPAAPAPAPAPAATTTQPAAPAPAPEPKPAPAPQPAPVAQQPAAPKPAPAPAPVVAPAPRAAAPAPTPVAPSAPAQPAAPAPAPAAEAKPAVPAPVAPAPTPAPAPTEPTPEQGTIIARADQLKGLTVLGKIELPTDASRRGGGNRGARPVASSDVRKAGIGDKKKRQRIATPGPGGQQQGQGQGQGGNQQQGGNRQGGTGNDRPTRPANQGNRPGGHGGRDNRGGNPNRPAPAVSPEQSDKQIQDQIKATLARLSGGRGGNQQNRAKYRRDKRAGIAEAQELARQQSELASKTLKLTEFISANDLASLMNASVNDVIKVCLNMGMFVSINQRLDAEAITVIADEFGYDVEFLSAEDEQDVAIVDEDDPDALQDRAPIVTIMGHVDHGKTSLLDYIRNAQVAKGEAGGITQHIGAYEVTTESGRKITFLDTPGHEAFTAMRARGAKVTDIAIIVVAADDSVMPQTKEAINHAQAAGVPIVIALNKIDKPGANPDKVREELSAINILVEEWGGKYQSQEVSAKTGAGIEDLLEKVLLEAELLELKANPDRRAVGSVIEASLDKGRGYVTTILVQTGTLNVGDIVLAGPHYGRVKAMTDHRGKKMKSAGPSTPVQLLGLQGAPQAGDKVVAMETEREAREIATQRLQLQREQSMRTKKHITLDEIGRRLAIGSFKELNIIVKGDVDGSVEALSDSLLKLSTGEVAVNILSKGVGAISESDVLLASASDAIIIGFQVRPSLGARKLAEQEQIDIRLYSIIYNAINEVKDAMEGMLAPTVQEVTVATVEVRQVFNITKVGTIAGCMVTDGTITRNTKVRLVRDGIVQHTGAILALKRFKDDASEVRQGYECGISLKGFDDLREGDIIEGFEEKEVKRTL
ncbi:translation initiation factor IF-2 [Solirubrum puertoriconensis]|uniref:Translation initiation factor IF-2 n=1 Tax=Solirubrum puertoriconensis TaxID=1751427 RepID=A0A9X0HLP4_SOLP1|nr:translation initiation factor IF-2 [Solirubrum puertoriconensis]KUG08231.1 translation initiation factor IF-2 [Solirubrum puertoriconensis]